MQRPATPAIAPAQPDFERLRTAFAGFASRASGANRGVAKRCGLEHQQRGRCARGRSAASAAG